MRRSSLVPLLLAAALAAAAATAGCASPEERVSRSREVLGTAVTVTRWTGGSDVTEADAAASIEDAFDEMAAIEHTLSPYDDGSPVAAFNRTPFETHEMPDEALLVLDRVRDLGLVGRFSPTLFGVTAMYDFGHRGWVPVPAQLAEAVIQAQQFTVDADGNGRFSVVPGRKVPADTESVGRPGLDFGGASKGLALDRAAARLGGGPALLSAGSSTLTLGEKPGGEPWRVGIEDPRNVGTVIAMISAEGTLSVSTSGDYQTFFERGGVRYHHILDPVTGMPTRGLRSLTVFGRMNGLDADVLSTAMFVMGREDALAYARANGIGVHMVDDEGRVFSWVPPKTGVKLERKADPER